MGLQKSKKEKSVSSWRQGATAAISVSLIPILSGPSSAGLAYSPTTTVSVQTSSNTSASSAFTDIYYNYHTKKVQANANGDMVPANISKVSVKSLLTGDAANAKLMAYTQNWFCHNAANESNGLLITGTAPQTPNCGSHIDIGYNSGDATQIANTVADMRSRGFQGAIIDWEGPLALDPGSENYIQNTAAVDQFKKNGEASNGAFEFAIMEDEGVGGCLKGWTTCENWNNVGNKATMQAIYDMNYVVDNYAASPAYLHTAAGNPVIYVFGLDTYASSVGLTIDWAVVYSNLYTDPVTKQKPILVFENSTTHSEEGGAYSWVTPTAWTSYSTTSGDPFSLTYLSDVFGSMMSWKNSNTTHFINASAYKGFDDTVVNGWNSSTSADDSRYVDQQCGKTFLQSMEKINTDFSENKLDVVGIATWDDYEEATEVETGIDNCLTSLSPSISGSTVSWSPVFGSSIDGVKGDESTVHHYTVYVSTDGSNLMALPGTVASGTHSLSLSQFGLPTGSYHIFVQAVGQPMMRNTFAEANGTFVVGASTGGISGTVINASTKAALSGVAVSYSGGSTTTNSSGQFSFAAVKPGSYSVQASLAGYIAQSGSVTVTAPSVSTLTLPISTAGIIAGTVKNSSGAVLSGASVSIVGGAIATTVNLSASSSGTFTTTYIPIGTYTVTCSSAGYTSQASSVSLTAGGTPSVACALKSLAGTISGQVTDASTGAAIVGATVSYSGGSSVTNGSGNYSFTNVPAGSTSITISATDSGYLANSAKVTVIAGATATANVKVATAGIISGVVQSYSGPIWANAAVSIQGGVVPTQVSLTSDSSGKFTTTWIPVGTYTVTCTIPYPATNTYTVNLTAGQTLSVDCKL